MPRAKTVNHELENLSHIGSKLWDSIPSYMKKIDSINEFKHVIKTWKPDICAHADFVKFVYKILGICSHQKKKKNIYVYKNQNIIIVFPRLSYVIHLLFLV